MVIDVAEAKPFIFVCGPDDFLVNRLGKERFDELTRDVTDEFSREVLSGFANNVGEVEAAINRFRESVQTISMFGGKRVVWLKDVNFLADTVTGRAESTIKQRPDPVGAGPIVRRQRDSDAARAPRSAPRHR